MLRREVFSLKPVALALGTELDGIFPFFSGARAVLKHKQLPPACDETRSKELGLGSISAVEAGDRQLLRIHELPALVAKLIAGVSSREHLGSVQLLIVLW